MLLLLSACSFGETTEQKLSNILSDIYELESDYRDVQADLAETEIKEQTNFQSMMELTQDQQDELAVQVEDTAKILEERIALVEKEKTSIEAAREKMEELTSLVADTEDEVEKEGIKKVQDSLKKRYEAYDKLISEYDALTALQEDLYNMLLDEEANIGTIQDQVEQVNKQNEVVQQAVDKFNELTATLNDVKQEAFTVLKDE